MDAASFALIFFIAAIGFLVWIMRNLGKPQQHEIRTEQRHTQTVTYDHMRDPLGVRLTEAQIRELETRAFMQEAQGERAIAGAVLDYAKARQLPPPQPQPQTRIADIVQQRLGELGRGER